MTKRYSILQKKLQELELELNKVFSLPTDTPCHQLIAEGIAQRFVFVRHLLSAEMASHPKKPHHLQHISRRLTELESAFHDWENFRTSDIDHLDSTSTCSCTESCLNDDGPDPDPDSDDFLGLDGSVYEDPEVFGEGNWVEEKVGGDRVEIEDERVKGRCCGGRIWAVVFAFVVMGLAIVKMFSGFLNCTDYEHYDSTPT